MKHKYYYRIQYNNGESLMVIEGIVFHEMMDQARLLAKKYTDVVYWMLPVAYENQWLSFKKVTFNGANTIDVSKWCPYPYDMLTGIKTDLTKVYTAEELAAYNEALRHYKNFKNNA